ncbi:hypothetical protein EVG20_g2875 [Dentipellis fragilis]|uniref:Uncharacterized protein n=1 Tax=Dentipellis fragilis TaxID=205917 RepID=A0A4Y9Z9Q3_9AGAM|nr:hypothetical protein EVG20_g2875 [Dentipellis fragilis]
MATSNTTSIDDDLHAPDSTEPPAEGPGNCAASSTRAREHLDRRILSLASKTGPSDYPTILAAHHDLIASLPSGDPALNQLLHLFTRRNELSPIHILPPEIFSSILFYIVHDATEPPAVANKRLALLSMVCLSWRRAALSHPNLWTRIDLDQRIHAEFAFTRSQNAPIDLHYSERSRIDKISPHVLAAINDHVARIKSLSLSMYVGAFTQLMQIFPLSFPLLHTLQFDVMDRLRWRRHTHGHYFPPRASHLDPAIAHCAMPSLRVLKTRGMLLPLAFPMYHGLVHLALEPQNQITMEIWSLREMLAGCPELEFLRLCNLGLAPLDTASSPGTPVPLPKLRRLLLKNCAPGMISNLVIPSTATRRVMSPGLSRTLSGLSFFSSGGNDGKLYILNDGSDPQVLQCFPYVRIAVFESYQRDHVSTLNNLVAMFSELNMQHLEVLKAIKVPLTVLVEALSNRNIAALRKLVLISVPRIGPEEEMGENMKLLRCLVVTVKVTGFMR